MSVCDIQSGGYLGRDKTFEKIRNKYYWKGMFKDVYRLFGGLKNIEVIISK
jgi:hypothetical protein